MDVKYIPADWEKMRAGLSDLLGHGFGKGMFDHLKDVNEVLEDAERDIAKYDGDGAISFQHTSQNNLRAYIPLYSILPLISGYRHLQFSQTLP